MWLTRSGLTAYLLVLMATSGVSVADSSQPTPPATAESSQQLVNSPLLPLDYGKKSDVQLTELGARWDELTRPERDALLREVKLRMAQRRDKDGVLMIRTQRRYGRIYRSDGRYLKIETKVVQVRPAQVPADQQRRGFGTGFEQRTGTVSAEGDSSVQPRTDPAFPATEAATRSPPVVRVTDPS